MPKFYVPEDALQGQKVPGHLVWDRNSKVKSVRLLFSPSFGLDSVFNVDKAEQVSHPTELIVSGVERSGYFGFVLSSKRTEALEDNATVSIEAHFEDEEPFAETRVVSLFRPDLKVHSVPDSFRIDSDGHPSDLVRLERTGSGTLFLSLDVDENESIKSTFPPEVLHAFKGFAEDMEKGLAALEKKYPQYRDFFHGFEEVDLRSRDAVMSATDELFGLVKEDKRFLSELQEVISYSIVHNQDFELVVVRPLLEFIDSILSGGLLLTTPWLEFEFPEGSSNLVLNVEAKDILGFKLVQRKIGPIRVFAERAVTVPVSHLIRWGQEPGRRLPSTVRRRSRRKPRAGDYRPSVRRRKENG